MSGLTKRGKEFKRFKKFKVNQEDNNESINKDGL